MKTNWNKKKLSFIKLLLITFFILSAGVQKSFASHAAGGEITYHGIGGGCYIITMTFYRDCVGVAAPSSFPCNIISSCSTFTVTLNPITGTGQEITIPCAGQSTTCIGGTSPGIQKWVYESQVCGIVPCADWVFSTTMSGRNSAITTLNVPGGSAMYIEARLNNVVVANDNSPVFSVNPIVFVCVGQPFTFNEGAIDPDGDSLVYSSIAPRTSANTNVTYNSPYSPFNPLTSAPPVTVNPVTGDIVMHATVAGEVAVMDVLVQEYRGGVLIGSVVRDIEIYIVPCSNSLPYLTGTFSLTACAGSTINLLYHSYDNDAGQTVTVTWNNGIPAPATFTTTTGSRPVGTFHWVTTLADARSQPYTFTITVRDNGCPMSGGQVYSVMITLHALVVTATSTAAACNGGATGSATAIASGTGGPYTYVWSPGGVTGQTRNNMQAGTYTVIATDAMGCITSTTVVVAQPAPLIVTSTGGVGTATINVTGGTAPYTYSLNSHPAQSTSVITGVAPGTYLETVRDAHGCRSSCSVVIQ